jgi:kinesin family member 18/19
VTSAKDLQKVIIIGNERRTVAATTANQTSSRSHAILIINVETYPKPHSEYANTDPEPVSQIRRFAKLQIVDLAGSERATNTDNRGKRMVEGANINKSLLALGNCINSLSDRSNSKQENFVAYRDSKLTRLLKDSLGGNTHTIMLACISQFYKAYEETLNTLKYA